MSDSGQATTIELGMKVSVRRSERGLTEDAASPAYGEKAHSRGGLRDFPEQASYLAFDRMNDC
jgi:hypothetical protein